MHVSLMKKEKRVGEEQTDGEGGLLVSFGLRSLDVILNVGVSLLFLIIVTFVLYIYSIW